jgi:hypothetical protein
MPDVRLNVRRLVALDMNFIGPRVAAGEYAFGVLLPVALGVLSIRQGRLVFALPLLWIGLNYVPLLWYSIDLLRSGGWLGQTMSPAERSYAWRQAWILVPFAVVFFALSQRSMRSA